MAVGERDPPVGTAEQRYAHTRSRRVSTGVDASRGPAESACAQRAHPLVWEVCLPHRTHITGAVSIFPLADLSPPGVHVIRSVLALSAAGGNVGALEEFYTDQRILARARAFPGCRDAVLLRAIADSPATHLVIADWDTAGDYQRWIEDPWRVAVSRQLADLLDTESNEPVVGGVFEFVPTR